MLTILVADLTFCCVVLIWIVYSFLFAQTITAWEFLMALMANVLVARFLIYSDIQLALVKVEVEQENE